MATVADLERLQNLVQRLTPLSAKRRGELIEAGDWNQLAGALLELARISLGDEAGGAVPVHEHADQVDVGWLTPRLRALVTEGGLRDPAAAAELARLDRQLKRAMEGIEALTQRLDRLQGDVKTVETRDVTRQADLTRFARRLDGAFDAREDVAGLRATLRTLEIDVRAAVDLSRRLQEPNGAQIDFADLAGRLKATEALRDALTTPTGRLLDAAEYERRLEELRASLVTEAELDEALDGVRKGVEGGLRDAVLEETRGLVASTLQQSLEAVRGELTGRIDQRLSGLDAMIDARLAPATQDLRADVLAAARAERVAELDTALSGLRAEVEAGTGERISALQGNVSAQLEAQRAEIRRELDATLPDRIGAATAELGVRLKQVETQAGALQAASAESARAAQENATAIAAARRELAAADGQLRADYTRRIGELDAGLDARIDARVGTVRTDLRAQLQADVDGMVRALETRLNETIRRSVGTEVTLAGNRLRAEVTTIVDTQLAGVRAEIDRTVAERVAASGTRLNGLVAEEVRRSLAGLDERVRREVEAFEPQRTRAAGGTASSAAKSAVKSATKSAAKSAAKTAPRDPR